MAAAVAIPIFRIYDLPWSTGEEQEQAFKRKVKITLAVILVLALILSFLPLPQPDPAAIEEIPQRLARLVIEQQPLPPPPPIVREEPVPEEIVEPEPEPERVVEERAEPEPVPEPEPVDTVQQARERASVAGLLPFAQELAALRENDSLERLGQTDLVDGDVGLGGSGAPGPGAGPITERSLITSRVGTSSGGINTASLSRNTGGGGLAGRTTTQVESPVAGIGDSGGTAVRSGDSDRASRSREEIERVFDRNKGAIYALYNRALRENPALEGKVVLRLTISPAGVVTSCEIVSSELGDPDLEQKLVQRVLLFQFEAKDVESVTTTKPIDFFPA
jgi:periplasmic protein TonB